MKKKDGNGKTGNIGPGKSFMKPSQSTHGTIGPGRRFKGDESNGPGFGGGSSGGGALALRKKRTLIIIATAAVALIAILVIVLVVNSRPLKITISGPESLATTNGVIESSEFKISANKSIKNVSYAVTREDDDDSDSPQNVSAKGKSKKEVTVTVPELKIEPGDSSLSLRFESSFGKYQTVEIPMNFDVGFSEPYEADAVLTLEEGTKLVSNELLVDMKEGVTDEEAQALFAKYGATVVGRIYMFNNYQLRFASKMDRAALNNLHGQLEAEEIVESATYNFVLDAEIDTTPNDSKYDSWDVSKPEGNNWGLETIDAPGAWGYNKEMKSVKVGVVDGIVDPDHEDLKIPESHLSIMRTNDFKSLPELVKYNDDHGGNIVPEIDHGSHVSGIIGARANNGKGISGVNWFSDLYFSTYWYYMINPTDDSVYRMSSSFASDALNLTHLVASGCRVLNYSVGSTVSTSSSPEETDVIEEYEKWLGLLENNGYDFLICKSAGNGGADLIGDDASTYLINRIMVGGEHGRAHTIIVGSIRPPNLFENIWEEAILGGEARYKKANSSNFGNMVDVYAPGVDIYSTVYGDDKYEKKTGTSMAAPMVAGVASLVYSIDPDFDYKYVKTITTNSAKDFVEISQGFYPIVNAARAVKFATMRGDVPPLEKPKAGFAKGLIQDAKTGDIITNAAVSFDNGTSPPAIDDVDTTSGEYETWLSPGTYTMRCAAPGYLEETIYDIEVTEGIVSYNILLNMIGESSAEGTASGRVVNAFDASSIPNAKMDFYRGINNPGNDLVKSINSDGNGNYSISLPPGNYTAKVSAEGYMKSSTNIIIISGEERGSQDCTVTPILNPGEIRFVLTWGQYPSDLDSHLVGPAPDGRFHTFFEDMNYYFNGQKYDNLDKDDTTSYGPETTSVHVGVGGEYTFYIHDYSNRGASSSTGIARSGAQVKVYVAGAENAVVFNAPSGQGTLWKVCTINGSTIVPQNVMSYESNPGRVGQ
jgi:hypothetical protein